ncbi:MAG TPA: HD domain-containing phosphohydrolase [Spirochaetia bacterium]|nr:HD domain-containing phosphohydrolase [Spirochaetia bacterium]
MKEVLLRIIEEFSEGFLILDRDHHVVFFNDVLLKTTGLQTSDILDPEGPFLKSLGLSDLCQSCEREAVVEDKWGTPRRFIVSCLVVESETGPYVVARLRAAAAGGPQEAVRFRGQLEQLFRNIGDPIISADLDGTIALANPSFYQLIGWDESEALPNISALYAHRPELEDKILRLAESDMVYNLETHLTTKGRQLRRVLDTSWVTRDGRGVVTGYTAHFKDVTYVKNLEARLRISERNYMLLFDTILSSIIIVDPLGRILNCNYFAEKMYGWLRHDLVNREFDEVFQVHKKGLPMTDIIGLVNRNRGRYVETDVPRRCQDGTIKFTYASYSALTSTTGETIAYAIMERDLTERVRLEKKLQASFEQIKDTQSAAILGFARLTEYRDVDTGKHLERIREYTRVLATALARLPAYSDYITPDYIEDLCLSSVLHDVGKVGIEDALLLKPGRLDEREFEKIKLHATLGGEALRAVDQEIKRESFLTIGKEVAFYHHERWDGSGYPAGKKGDQIPLSARIVALADVYDALTSRRSYKEALSHEDAVKIIVAEKGTHFDPDIVQVFEESLETFKRIHMLESFKEHPASIADLLTSPDN